MPQKISACRICKNTQLEPVLDLGHQALTGVFPATKEQPITVGPLRLVKCQGAESCGLLQLEHSYDLAEMYGDNYGYRSGLNSSMVRHLDGKIQKILTEHEFEDGALVIDIGSNDSTTLQSYPSRGLTLLGVDPTGTKFSEYYPEHIHLIADFFSADSINQRFPGKQASIITSFSMFYDLESPMDFMRDVHSVLKEGGLWIFEQSYMPTMLEMNSYDTACHEHLEYYAIKQILWMADRVGFSIIDVELNDINGGSFSITAKKTQDVKHASCALDLLAQESRSGLDALTPFLEFAKGVAESRNELIGFLDQAKAENKKVCALGASTKGNVLLQYCDIDESQIAAVGEVNPEKYGKLTPGTHLPIVDEQQLLQEDWDYLIVLPWHFKSFFMQAPHLINRNLVFPLPKLHTCAAKP